MGSSQYRLKAGSRTILRGTSERDLASVHLPLANKQGYVFLVADFPGEKISSVTALAILQESVELLATGLNAKLSHPQHLFEQTLQRVNGQLKKVLAYSELATDAYHAALGMVHEGQLTMTGTGQLHALLFRKTETGRVRMYDVLHSVRSDMLNTSQEKGFFSAIIDGDIQPHDVLFFATAQLPQLLRPEDLHPLLLHLPPASVLESIEQYMPIKAQLGLTIFQAHVEDRVKVDGGALANPLGGVLSLLKIEDRTQQLVAFAKPDLRKLAKQAIDRLPKAYLQIITTRTKRFAQSIKLAARPKWQRMVSSGAEQKQSNQGKKPRISLNDTGVLSLAATQRTRLVGTILGVLLIAGIIVPVVQRRNKTLAEQEYFAQEIVSIEEKRHTAEASLIYKNETAAYRLLEEAQAQINNLEAKNENQTSIKEQQSAEIAILLNRLQHVYVPEISSIAFPQDAAARSLGGDFILFEDGRMGLVRDGAILIQQTPEGPPLEIRLASVNTTGATIINRRNTLTRFDAGSNTNATIGINTAEDELSLAADLSIYDRRLYVLSPRLGQIYRHQQVENGDYGPAGAWLNPGIDVSGLTTLAVDGTIWAAGANQLRQFDRGAEVAINAEAIQPPIGEATDIWTATDTNFLLLLDTKERRLLVFDKERETVLGQYIDERFAEGLAIDVDISSNLASILTPTELLQFSFSESL